MIPAMRPVMGGVPDATAIPKQSGRATKNTTRLAGTSYLSLLKSRGFTGISFLDL
jgi:hypothetical protein